jgi:hypothetical protein
MQMNLVFRSATTPHSPHYQEGEGGSFPYKLRNFALDNRSGILFTEISTEVIFP